MNTHHRTSPNFTPILWMIAALCAGWAVALSLGGV